MEPFKAVPTRRYNVQVHLHGEPEAGILSTSWHLGSKTQEEVLRLEETLAEAFGLSGFEVEAKPQFNDLGVLVNDLYEVIGERLSSLEEAEVVYEAEGLKNFASQARAQWHSLTAVENALADLLYEEREHRIAEMPEGHCPHGVYVGGCGIDWMCGACEDGRII